MPCGVLDKFSMRSNFATTSLIKLDNTPQVRIKILTINWLTPSPWTSVQNYYGLTLRISRLFKINGIAM
jgi:hypothetical protein